MEFSKKLKSKLNKLTISAIAIVTVMVLVFACSKMIIEDANRVATLSQAQNYALPKNEIAVIKDATGINLNVTGFDDSGVDTIEVYQGTNKVKEYTYTGSETTKEESLQITIPFGETHTITVMVNGETVAQKEVQNMRYISTADDMVKFRNIVNAGNNFSGKYVELLNDIDLSSVCSSTKGSFTPIANSLNFAGSFNGNYHTVSNLYISQTNVSAAGLFGYNSGIIENLIMSNVYIYNYGNQVNLGLQAGSIAGNNSGTVRNCGVNSGSVTSTNTAASPGSSGYRSIRAAGVVGNNSGTVNTCYNRATVYSQTLKSNGARTECFAAGISGGFGISNLFNCYNAGSVTANGTNAYAGSMVGAIIWASTDYKTIENCYNVGNITASGYNSSSTRAGSIIGNATKYLTIRNSYYTSSAAAYNTGGYGNPTTSSLAKVSATTLQGYANTLGSAIWVNDVYGINNGYPLLRWQVPQIQLNKKQEYVSIGEKIKLTVDTSKYSASQTIGTITWTSDNTSVATVDNSGEVTAVGEGTTTIYATESSYGLKAMMIVNVSKSGAVAIPKVENGGYITSNNATIVLKEDGTVWRSRR